MTLMSNYIVHLLSLSVIITSLLALVPIVTPQLRSESDAIVTLNFSPHSTILSSIMFILSVCDNTPSDTVTILLPPVKSLASVHHRIHVQTLWLLLFYVYGKYETLPSAFTLNVLITT